MVCNSLPNFEAVNMNEDFMKTLKFRRGVALDESAAPCSPDAARHGAPSVVEGLVRRRV